MRVTVIGPSLGGDLGRLLARAGHDVIFTGSRDPKKLARAAELAGPNARLAWQAGLPCIGAPPPGGRRMNMARRFPGRSRSCGRTCRIHHLAAYLSIDRSMPDHAPPATIEG